MMSVQALQGTVHHTDKTTGQILYSYELVREIGKGGFGTVYLAHERPRNREVAVKVLDRLQLKEKHYSEDRVRNEIDIQVRLRHEHVVEVLDAFYDDSKIYIVMEFCSRGDLRHEIENRRKSGNPKFSESEARRIIYQIGSGLRYLHRNGITHRDINVSNIFLTAKGVYKIGDFGLATLISDHESSNPISAKKIQTHRTMCGTPSSIAPEVVSQIPYTNKVDVWGLGVILYTLLVENSPFDDGKFQSTIRNVKYLNPHFPTYLSKEATHLINGMLQKEEEHRLNIDQVLNDEFFYVSSSFTCDSGIGNSNLQSSNGDLTTTNSNLNGHQPILLQNLTRSSSFKRWPSIRKPLSGISEDGNLRALTRARSATSSLQNCHMEISPLPLRARWGSLDKLNNDIEGEVGACPGGREEDYDEKYKQQDEELDEQRQDNSKSSILKEKLNTKRLKPSFRKIEIKPGVVGGILPNGQVEFEFEIAKKNSGRKKVERVNVSEDGNIIRVERRPETGNFTGEYQEYKYDYLPKNYYQKYNVIAQYVQGKRERMPKVTLYTFECECFLMENEKVPNFQVNFYDGPKLSFESSKNRIVCKYSTGNEESLNYPLTRTQMLSNRYLQKFEQYHTECKEHSSYLEGQGLEMRFPVIFGRRKENLKSNKENPSRKSPIPMLSGTAASTTMSRISNSRSLDHFSIKSESQHFTQENNSSAWKELRYDDDSCLWMEVSREGQIGNFVYTDSLGCNEVKFSKHQVEKQDREVREKVLQAMKYVKSKSESALRSWKSQQNTS